MDGKLQHLEIEVTREPEEDEVRVPLAGQDLRVVGGFADLPTIDVKLRTLEPETGTIMTLNLYGFHFHQATVLDAATEADMMLGRELEVVWKRYRLRQEGRIV